MSEDKGYNGWVNFETWQAALWVNNDYGLYSWLMETAEDLISDDPDVPASYLAEDLGKMLDDSLYETLEVDDVSGLLGDIVISWWSRVDWREIAEGYVEEAFDQWQRDNG